MDAGGGHAWFSYIQGYRKTLIRDTTRRGDAFPVPVRQAIRIILSLSARPAIRHLPRA